MVYLAAVAASSRQASRGLSGLKDQHEKSKLGPLILADPQKIGSLRIDPRSTDTDYLEPAREALAADVDADLLKTVMHLLTPDVPVSIYGEVANFPDEFAAQRRRYVRCTQDHTLVPTTCDAIVADMNSAWPDHPTEMVDLGSSHEAMFSQPQKLAELLIASA